MASQDGVKFNKYITWGLLASTILFMILFILFTILFATKDDDSTSFLLTGTSGSTADVVSKEIKDKLGKKFHVNDITLNMVGSTITVVFSLRGKQTVDKVQPQINQVSTLKDAALTDGTTGYYTCHAQTISNPCTCITTTPPPQNTTSTFSTAATTSAGATPVQGFYCADDDLQREIVIVVDLMTTGNPANDTDRTDGLKALGTKMQHSFNFGLHKTRVYVLGADKNGPITISTNFTSNYDDFMNDWNQLQMKTENGSASDQINIDLTLAQIKTLSFDPKKPIEVVIITAHDLNQIQAVNQLNTRGYFVAVVQATKYVYNVQPNLISTGVMKFDDFASLAAFDPFSTLACQFSYQQNSVQPQQASFSDFKIEEPAIFADGIDNSCQKVDIMFVFDTSQSVTPPLMEKYKAFASSFVSRFKLSGGVQVGIVQFSDSANVTMQLGQHSLDDFNAVVKNIQSTGGMTNTQDALNKCLQEFRAHEINTHGHFVVFMTDGQPTVGNLNDTENTGNLLAKTADIFFVGVDRYEAGDITELAKINGHPEWVYNTTDSATQLLPGVFLTESPCPEKVCAVAYFAIEVSQADLGHSFIPDSLAFLNQVVDKYNLLKPNNTNYQLMVYNLNQTMFPDAPVNYDSIKKILQNFNPSDFTKNGIGGHVALDKAFYTLADNIVTQTTLFDNVPYQSNVIFCGEANTYTIDPLSTSVADKQKQLSDAYNYLLAQTNGIYVFDGSQNAEDYGQDLWAGAVPPGNIVNDSATAFDSFAQTGYFQQIQNFTCDNVLASIARCDYNFIDVAVVLDVVGDATNITSYLTTFLGQFDTTYPSHFSMFAMGDGHNVATLAPLQAWETANLTATGFNNWNNWKIGVTTAATTKKAAPAEGFEDPAVVLDYPMTNSTLQSMFTVVHEQFGCPNYNSNADRVEYPNVVMIVSDNFGSYTEAMWNSIPSIIQNVWGCYDCAGKPQLYFMTMTDVVIPDGIGFGSIYVHGDDYNLGLAKSIRTMSQAVTSLCQTKMWSQNQCLSLDQNYLCQKP